MKVRRHVAEEHGLGWREANFLAAIQKAAHKSALLNALCGRFPQPRDPARRYPRPATDFSGGARRSVPPPPETHEQTISRVLHTGESDVGANF